MSEQYPGGFITRTPPEPTATVARGLWTLSQAAGYKKQGLWPTSPGAPTIGTATGGDTTASVAFTAPANAGSAAITSYTATSSPGGLTGTGASSPITVSGLTNGTAYTFTVTATNGAGTGPASAASNSVTPIQINYVEEVFSTWLYTGSGADPQINNGIDLAGKGGMVWIKSRNLATNNVVWDTVTSEGGSGANDKYLVTNTAAAQASVASPGAWQWPSSGGSGFRLAGGLTTPPVSQDTTPGTYSSWTFREQPKFFDVVTYTGNGTAGRTVAHNLGSVPGWIIVKSTSNGTNWCTYHRSLGNDNQIILNQTAPLESSALWNYTNPTSSVFSVNNDTDVNGAGRTYVAYLFAHNAGGFGLTGTDNVISCNSYTGNGSATGPVIDLGYEPQWLLVKQSSSTGNWFLADTMRGFDQISDQFLLANSSGAEFTRTNYVKPLATGFQIVNADFDVNESGGTYIYIAIRRGPMKVPTTSTSVYYPLARTGTGTATSISGVGFVPDFFLSQNRNTPGDPGPASALSIVLSRLTNLKFLRTQTTSAQSDSTEVTSWNQAGVSLSADTFGRVNDPSVNTINYFIGRAPSFMDVVCYTGTGSTRTVAHNLTVAPELVIVKVRSTSGDNWFVLSTPGTARLLRLNSSAEDSGGVETVFGNGSVYIAPTSTNFTVGGFGPVNQSGSTFVSYLFATCPGVSKVGSYTGTGTTQTINCGFTAGSRFVMIKRTDSTGDWYVWDSARGIIPSNDPYLLLNGTAAEVTGTDYVDTTSVGFEISSTAPSAINANGGTYIFLAIA